MNEGLTCRTALIRWNQYSPSSALSEACKEYATAFMSVPSLQSSSMQTVASLTIHGDGQRDVDLGVLSREHGIRHRYRTVIW